MKLTQPQAIRRIQRRKQKQRARVRDREREIRTQRLIGNVLWCAKALFVVATWVALIVYVTS